MAGSQTAAELKGETAGEMFDVVFDVTGSAAAMQAALNYIAHAGTYVLVSVVNSDITFSDPEFHRREATLMGSRNGPPKISSACSLRCARAASQH